MKSAVSIGNMDGNDKKKFTSSEIVSWGLKFPLVMYPSVPGHLGRDRFCSESCSQPLHK